MQKKSSVSLSGKEVHSNSELLFGIRLNQGPEELNVNFLGDPQCGINPTQTESLYSLQVTWHMECTDFLIPENTEMK